MDPPTGTRTKDTFVHLTGPPPYPASAHHAVITDQTAAARETSGVEKEDSSGQTCRLDNFNTIGDDTDANIRRFFTSSYTPTIGLEAIQPAEENPSATQHGQQSYSKTPTNFTFTNLKPIFTVHESPKKKKDKSDNGYPGSYPNTRQSLSNIEKSGHTETIPLYDGTRPIVAKQFNQSNMYCGSYNGAFESNDIYSRTLVPVSILLRVSNQPAVGGPIAHLLKQVHFGLTMYYQMIPTALEHRRQLARQHVQDTLTRIKHNHLRLSQPHIKPDVIIHENNRYFIQQQQAILDEHILTVITHLNFIRNEQTTGSSKEQIRQDEEQRHFWYVSVTHSIVEEIQFFMLRGYVAPELFTTFLPNCNIENEKPYRIRDFNTYQDSMNWPWRSTNGDEIPSDEEEIVPQASERQRKTRPRGIKKSAIYIVDYESDDSAEFDALEKSGKITSLFTGRNTPTDGYSTTTRQLQ